MNTQTLVRWPRYPNEVYRVRRVLDGGHTLVIVNAAGYTATVDVEVDKLEVING